MRSSVATRKSRIDQQQQHYQSQSLHRNYKLRHSSANHNLPSTSASVFTAPPAATPSTTVHYSSQAKDSPVRPNLLSTQPRTPRHSSPWAAPSRTTERVQRNSSPSVRAVAMTTRDTKTRCTQSAQLKVAAQTMQRKTTTTTIRQVVSGSQW